MVQLIEALATDRARRVNTKYGERTVIDAVRRDTGEKITLWRPSDDDYSKKFIVRDMPITVAIDAKGKFSLVENPDHLKLGQPLPAEPVPVKPVHTYNHKIDNSSESDQSSLSPNQKREIANYVQEMAKLYKYCLDQVESTIGVEGEDRRAIATTLYLSAQKKFAL
jgi:hypothetical protein